MKSKRQRAISSLRSQGEAIEPNEVCEKLIQKEITAMKTNKQNVTNKVSHTPTPWSWNVNFIVEGNDPNANGARIVMPLFYPITRSKYEGMADAEFIVRAVNIHKELVGFLKYLVDSAEDNAPAVMSEDELIKQAKHLIAQAEGKAL